MQREHVCVFPLIRARLYFLYTIAVHIATQCSLTSPQLPRDSGRRGTLQGGRQATQGQVCVHPHRPKAKPNDVLTERCFTQNGAGYTHYKQSAPF